MTPHRPPILFGLILLAALSNCSTNLARADDTPPPPTGPGRSTVARRMAVTPAPAPPPTAIEVRQRNEPKPAPSVVAASRTASGVPFELPTFDQLRPLGGVALLGLASLAPAVVLMFTSFVRINIVLILLRQALGSPQVPGNQVLTALAILLSTLVMKPVAESVYVQGIQPYAAGRLAPLAAWEAATTPMKEFMVRQIQRTGHLDYLWDLYDIAEPPEPDRIAPTEAREFPLRAVAPAFLLSEITTALMIGFLIYLPFLVVDLVVAAVLSAMGLFMLPPSLVAMPLKLILFVLADGWLLVATALLRTFAVD